MREQNDSQATGPRSQMDGQEPGCSHIRNQDGYANRSDRTAGGKWLIWEDLEIMAGILYYMLN